MGLSDECCALDWELMLRKVGEGDEVQSAKHCSSNHCRSMKRGGIRKGWLSYWTITKGLHPDAESAFHTINLPFLSPKPVLLRGSLPWPQKPEWRSRTTSVFQQNIIALFCTPPEALLQITARDRIPWSDLVWQLFSSFVSGSPLNWLHF